MAAAGAANGEGGAGKLKMGRGMARAGAGGVKAAFRRVVAYAVRATATRGRRRGHAARGLCRRSATERAIQFRQNTMAEPDSAIST